MKKIPIEMPVRASNSSNSSNGSRQSLFNSSGDSQMQSQDELIKTQQQQISSLITEQQQLRLTIQSQIEEIEKLKEQLAFARPVASPVADESLEIPKEDENVFGDGKFFIWPLGPLSVFQRCNKLDGNKAIALSYHLF